MAPWPGPNAGSCRGTSDWVADVAVTQTAHRRRTGTSDSPGAALSSRIERHLPFSFAALGRQLLASVGVVTLVGAWQLAAAAAESPFFPPPVEILAQFRETWFSGPASALFTTAEFHEDVIPSLSRAVGGWLLAAVIGIPLGIAVGLSRKLEDYVDPVIGFLRAVPASSYLPLFLIILGVSSVTRIAFITFPIVLVLFLNAATGVRSVDPLQFDTARAFKVARHRVFTHIILPRAAPDIFAGLRIALPYALGLMVISEFAFSTDGLGQAIIEYKQTFAIPAMWAGIVMLAAAGIFLNGLLTVAERRMLAWHRGATGSFE